jgi:hypothetical protein
MSSLLIESYITTRAGLDLSSIPTSNTLRYHTMSSEDVLPTYEEAVKMQQTPWHIIEEEAMHITFKEPSATSKIKSFISRAESASQHDVFAGVKRKSKTVLFIESLLTGEYGAHDILQSYQNTNVSFQLEHQESTTQQSPEHTKDRRAQRRQHPKTLNSAKRFRLEVQPCTAACAAHLLSRLGPLDHYSPASSRQLLVVAMHDCDSVGSLGPHCRSLRAIKGL